MQLMEENERLKQQVSTAMHLWDLILRISSNPIPSFFLWCVLIMAASIVCLKVMEASTRHRQMAADDSENILYEEGQSSESVTNVCSSTGGPQDSESSDTSLKLG